MNFIDSEDYVAIQFKPNIANTSKLFQKEEYKDWLDSMNLPKDDIPTGVSEIKLQLSVDVFVFLYPDVEEVRTRERLSTVYGSDCCWTVEVAVEKLTDSFKTVQETTHDCTDDMIDRVEFVVDAIHKYPKLHAIN